VVNLPIQGPPNPEDDTHYDEYFSEAKITLLHQRECIHDYQELNDTFCHCRICGKVERWENLPADNSNVLMRAEGMSFLVPMSCLPEEFQVTIKRRRAMRQGEQK
jgi:hypothetical protein